jgi:hypothetical protein
MALPHSKQNLLLPKNGRQLVGLSVTPQQAHFLGLGSLLSSPFKNIIHPMIHTASVATNGIVIQISNPK